MERVNPKEYSDSFKYGFDDNFEISPEIKKMTREERLARLEVLGFRYDGEGNLMSIPKEEK